MPTDKPRIMVVVEEELLEDLDDYRRSQKQIPSRSEAIRQLLKEGLKKHKK
jgi:metal-responsive CopG/Arc/MetJ family transcriptional regulator